ncbi:MAG: diacylglycerol kinase, partial [Cyanobacteriota bacterium]|nr:diacylglycerol kinase [Cyanobacteriota bacterium]
MTLNQPLTTSKREAFSSSQLLQSDRALHSTPVASPNAEPPESEFQSDRRLAWKIAPNLLVSFKYAWAGLRYAFTTQRNFRLHTVIGTAAICTGVYLQRTAVEMA